jgi:transposase
MIFPSHRVRIMVATKPIDFRKGHDSLAAMVKNELRKDPFTGTVFVFRARKADRLKLFYWDGTGLVMAYKRLEERSFVSVLRTARAAHLDGLKFHGGRSSRRLCGWPLASAVRVALR